MLCLCKKVGDQRTATCSLLGAVLKLADDNPQFAVSFEDLGSACSRCKKHSHKTLKIKFRVPVCCQCFADERDPQKVIAQRSERRSQTTLVKAEPFQKRSLEEYLGELVSQMPLSNVRSRITLEVEEADAGSGKAHHRFQTTDEPTLAQAVSVQKADTQQELDHPESEGFTWKRIISWYYGEPHSDVLADLVSQFPSLAASGNRRFSVDYSQFEDLRTDMFLKIVFRNTFFFWQFQTQLEDELPSLILKAHFPISSFDCSYISQLKNEAQNERPVEYVSFLTSRILEIRSKISQKVDQLASLVQSSAECAVLSDKKGLDLKKNYLGLMRHLHNFSRLFSRFLQVDEDFKNFCESAKSSSETEDEWQFVDCAICMGVVESAAVVTCSKCHQVAHFCCLNITEVADEKQFLCPSCEPFRENRKFQCFICKKHSHFLRPLAEGSVFHYHVFCLVISNAWHKLNMVKSSLKVLNLRNHQVCSFCPPVDANQGLVILCSKCQQMKHHAMCAFLSGCFFEIRQIDKFTPSNLEEHNYTYEIFSLCKSCSINYLSESEHLRSQPIQLPGPLVEANAFYRNRLIDPSFAKLFPKFEAYLDSIRTPFP